MGKKRAGEGEAARQEPGAGEPEGGASAEEERRRKEEKRARKRAKKAGEAGASAEPPSPAAPPAAQSAEDAAYRLEHSIGVGEGTDAASLPPCVRDFCLAPFSPSIVAALRASYASPTPIQAQAWPIALSGIDLIAVAKTGSGKTLAFLLPALHAIPSAGAAPTGSAPSPRGLVLAPTRELAIQIEAEGAKFGRCVGIATLCVFGGAPVHAQKAALARGRPALLVATPGRLVDLLQQKALELGGCGLVTLDEADRMLDMGFEPQISAIFAQLPAAARRQTLCFTATWPKAVRKLAASYLRPGATATLFIGGGSDAELEANRAVSQLFIHATDDEKDKTLYTFLCALPEGARVVVFANTKRRVESLSKRFWEEGFGTCAIHGDKKQPERDAALASFIANKCPLMFATDVAARGLDIKGVTHVVNFDMAKDVESYVHRIGRTGRAGELGASVTFWNPDYDKECAPALVKIARDAGQPVPDWLAKFEKARAGKQWKVEDATLAPPKPAA